MTYDRIHVYRVDPQKGVEQPTVPEGGGLVRTAAMSGVLQDTFDKADLEQGDRVFFNLKGEGRGTSPVRDLFMQFAFDGRRAKSASESMALRLSTSMDKRASRYLFVLASGPAEREGSRKVTAWIFPEDDAFKFSIRGGEPDVEHLTNLFSRRGHLRKAAHFSGRNDRHGFLDGTLLDKQNKSQGLPAADYWINDVLDCSFEMSGPVAAVQVSRALRGTADDFTDVTTKAAVLSTANTLANAAPRNWSAEEVSRLLPAAAQAPFLDRWPKRVARDATFPLEGSVISDEFQFRHFDLHSGVVVTTSSNHTGVELTEQDEPHESGSRTYLTCEGYVVNQRGSKRRA
ncbi:MAG: hypothetical protein AABY18_04710 [Candidatus Thermoplasmatota archaeon]